MELERLKIDRSPRNRRGGRTRRRGRLVRLLVGLAVVGAALLFLRAPIVRFYDRITLPAVETVRAVKSNPLSAAAVSGTAANGYIVAARRAALSADTPGRVVEMNVEEGSVVRAGDVVARLYSEEYEAALRQAEAELEAARSTVARAEAELGAADSRLATFKVSVEAAVARLDDIDKFVERSKVDHARVFDLKARNAATQQDVDNARTQLDRALASRNREQALVRYAESGVLEGEAERKVAAARMSEARAQVEIRSAVRDQARATLAKTAVKAPFDGIVVLKDAEVGEVVSPNSQGGNSRGSVVTMVDFASLEVQVELPERTLSAVHLDQAVQIFLDAYPETRFPGIVRRIWPTANRQKGTVELRVGFDRPDDRLRPEMGVRVVFLPDAAGTATEAPATEAPAVMVPDSCLTSIDGQPGVFLLERDRARWRSVTLGERRGGRVVVLSGLEGGENLVMKPPTQLEDGARVRIAP